MPWLQKLYDTYEVATQEGVDENESRPMPICHTTQQAQIEIVLDQNGNFKRASILTKPDAKTLLPSTESSAGRAGSKPVNHPLCDKLQYVAGDFLDHGGSVTSGYAKTPTEPHDSYLADLASWAESEYSHPTLTAIHTYVKHGSVISDLFANGILPCTDDNKFVTQWDGDKESTPAIFKVISKTQSPSDAFVRWRIETVGEKSSAPWEDSSFVQSWVRYYQSRQSESGLCMAIGEQAPLAIQSPSKIRHSGDKAKLISANDSSGFTYRGRFLSGEEAATIGFEMTQKSHSALRWLIEKQAYKNGDQIVLSWAASGHQLPSLCADTFELLTQFAPPEETVIVDTEQDFAVRFGKAIAGYRQKLEPREDVSILVLDSATTGRLAVVLYRELLGSEFLSRIETWHERYAWSQRFSKDRQFIGAPAPMDIAKAAYGSRLDDKIKKSVIERVLPCIVDGYRLPPDLLASVIHAASSRHGKEPWEWEKYLGIACSLYRGANSTEDYKMSLEIDRKSRDYLYGRLLAIADDIEKLALYVAGEQKGRTTSAARLMQRFSNRPFSTWKTIKLALQPYEARLRSNRAGALHKREQLIDEISDMFETEDFINDSALSGEFLLGFHCQRRDLQPKTDSADAERTPELI